MIFARSPFIVTINELSQESTRVELFIWNGTGSAPATPTYSLSKKVPSINNLATYYNISPFLREYFDFTQSGAVATASTSTANQYSYCNVTYKRYYTLDGVETLLNTTTDKAFDGFSYFNDGSNYIGEPILLTNRGFVDSNIFPLSNVYNYPCDIQDINDIGFVTIHTTTDWAVRYTNLDTNTTQTVNLSNNSVVNVRRIYSGWGGSGNKFEILLNNIVQSVFWFVPQCECKYQVFKVDFINRWGAWQREFFYKASTESIEMENNKFKANPVPFPAYDTKQAQYQTFNTNGKRSYKLNTGWVNESYKQVIEEMLLSEVIRVNELPATLRTKSVEKFKSINTKTINYQMEFEMAYDVINSIS